MAQGSVLVVTAAQTSMVTFDRTFHLVPRGSAALVADCGRKLAAGDGHMGVHSFLGSPTLGAECSACSDLHDLAHDTTDPAVNIWAQAYAALRLLVGCDTCRQTPAETIKEN